MWEPRCAVIHYAFFRHPPHCPLWMQLRAGTLGMANTLVLVPWRTFGNALRVFWTWLQSIRWVSLRGAQCCAFGSPGLCEGCRELLGFSGSSWYLALHKDEPRRNCKGSHLSRILFQKKFCISFPFETVSTGFCSVVLSSSLLFFFLGPKQESTHTSVSAFVVWVFHLSAIFFFSILRQHRVFFQIWLQLGNKDFSIVRAWIKYNFWCDRKRTENISQIYGLKYFFTIVAAAKVFLSLDTFTTILQLKFLGPKILQKEEMEITECKLSKETILGFPKVKNTK